MRASLVVGLCGCAAAQTPCAVIPTSPVIFRDQHDGDQKLFTLDSATLAFTITPYGNNETWTVNSQLDPTFCNASIDFRVPGKPGPPPIALTMTAWNAGFACDKATTPSKHVLTFNDPTGQLAPATTPLNAWVETGTAADQTASAVAPVEVGAKVGPLAAGSASVFFDMHDGDQKLLTVAGDRSMKITPYNNNQTWEVLLPALDTPGCSVMIDFNVPGKPNPPPVKLLFTAYDLFHGGSKSNCDRTPIIFTDPSGTLAPSTQPLNTWVNNNPC